MRENIAIVGSGAVGVFTAYALLKKGLHVTLIDTGILPQDNKSPYIRVPNKSLFNKTYHGSILTLGQSIFDSSKFQNCTLAQSYVSGGLANIWGGFNSSYNLEQLTKLESIYGRDIIKNIEIASNFLEAQEVPSSLPGIEIPKLSLNFSIKNKFNQLAEERNFSYLPHSFLDKIVVNNKLQLKLKNINSNKEEFKSFDRIFLATGQVSTINILNNSSFITKKELFIKSHNCILKPISFKKTPSSEFILGSLKYKNHIHAQIYGPYSPIVKERRKKLLGPLFSSLGILQIFLSPEHSSSIKVDIKKNNLIFTPLTYPVHNILSEFDSYLFKNRKYFGFTSIPKISYKMRIGSGHHNYGALSSGTNLPPNLHILDSSVLPYVPAGSILQLTLANAQSIIDRIYEKQNH